MSGCGMRVGCPGPSTSDEERGCETEDEQPHRRPFASRVPVAHFHANKVVGAAFMGGQDARTPCELTECYLETPVFLTLSH